MPPADRLALLACCVMAGAASAVILFVGGWSPPRTGSWFGVWFWSIVAPVAAWGVLRGDRRR